MSTACASSSACVETTIVFASDEAKKNLIVERIRAEPGIGVRRLGDKVGYGRTVISRLLDELVAEGRVDRHVGNGREGYRHNVKAGR